MKIKHCYASHLDDCKGKLSREHVISKNVLGNAMETRYNGRLRTVGQGSFTVKNLCGHHNNKLSIFEEDMKKYLLWLVEDATYYDAIFKSKEIPHFRNFSISGNSIEKWFLKTAINYSFFNDGKDIKYYNFPYLVKRLFNDAKFDFPYGMSYFQTKKSLNNLFPGNLSFDYHFDGNEIFGITINFQGNIFFMCLPTENSHRLTRIGMIFNDDVYYPYNPLINDSFDPDKLKLIWHPDGMQMNQLNAEGVPVIRSILNFNWNNCD